jgi:hypothetical protein
VAESFNPYRQWLELETDSQQPDYYQLLGLSPSESDPEVIRAAADRAAAKVRSFRPGKHAAVWARLLDELKEAKQCLTNPERKSAYDRKLRQARQAAPQAPSGKAAPVNQDSNLYPPGMAPKGQQPKSSASQPTKRPPAANAPSPQKTPRAAKPQKRPAEPGGQSAEAARPAANTDRVSLGLKAPGSEHQPVNAHLAPPPQQRPSVLPWIVVIAAIIVLATVAVLYIALYSDMAQRPDSTKSIAAAPNKQSRQVPSDPSGPGLPGKASRAQAAGAAQSSSSGGGSVVRRRAVTSGDGQSGNSAAGPAAGASQTAEPPDGPTDEAAARKTDQPSASDSSAAKKKKEPAADAEDPGPAAVDPALANSPYVDDPFGPPPKEESGGTEPTDTDSADGKRLTESLQAARSAIEQRDFDSARLELDKARLLAQSPEHKAQVQRLEAIGYQCQEFWDAVARAVSQLQGTEELSIGGGKLIVIVVEAGSDWLTIRRGGQNERYTLKDMPVPLALALVDRVLPPEAPKTLVMKGACLAMDREATDEYLDKALSLWLQAQKQGADVSQLAEALEDSRDLAR